jgi:hypothetical protein
MAQAPLHSGSGDPLHHLSTNIFCAAPPDHLSVEQLCALHEFFHTVLAAGYKLYQIVPADKAAAVLREKFGAMAAALPPPENAPT